MGILEGDVVENKPKAVTTPTTVGGSSTLPKSTGFGGPTPGEDTSQQFINNPNAIFWTSPSDGYGYTIADINAFLAELGYSWTIPLNLRPGTLDYDRYVDLLDNIDRRLESGMTAEPYPVPYTDFGEYGDELYAHAQYGIDMAAVYAQRGRGSGRRGAQGPVYVAPDPAAVEEFAKLYVVATTGTLHQNVVDGAAKAFIDATRRAFDNPEQEVDPSMAMKEFVRGTGEYKHVHELRPESVDEMQWVTSRQAQLRQLGLNSELAEKVGVNVSAVGAATPDVQTAGERAQIGATGRMLQTQRNRIKQRATTALRVL